VGVAYPELGQTVAEVLRLLGSHRAIIVHGDGGLDEITLSGNTSVWEMQGEEVRSWKLSVADTGLPERPIEAIRGGSKEENAATMRRLFDGEQGPVRDFVLVNSAAVLLVGGLVQSIRDGVEMAARTIDSGAARDKLGALADLSQQLAGK
jgi:anthranilate phosphoribosyltransferase